MDSLPPGPQPGQRRNSNLRAHYNNFDRISTVLVDGDGESQIVDADSLRGPVVPKKVTVTMDMDGQLSIDEDGHPTGKKETGFYCTPGQIFCAIFVGLAVAAAVGFLAFYLPVRTCRNRSVIGDPTNPAIIPDPTIRIPTRKPTIIPAATEEPWMGRLPLNVRPLRYDLTLTPYLYPEDVFNGPGRRRFTFDGAVNIRVRCEEVTNVITLHMNNITVYDLQVTSMSDPHANNLVRNSTLDAYYEFLHIRLSEDLRVHENYEIRIIYLGSLLQDGLVGFYRSSYINVRGEEKWLATTQMQPTDARRALPCFDEPELKAVYDIVIRHRSDMTALSNGIEITTRPWQGYKGWKETIFKRTPKMSTYLLAFVVSDFTYTANYTTNNVLYRVWSRPGAADSREYALDQGVRMTTYFEEYFDYPFPLEKQDMVAIPDFYSGAMENWGLILYRETALLYDPKVNSATTKQHVAVVVSHELAHQWFGNLVTPFWWDDLWLNEGFASYVEFLGVDYTQPGWEMRRQFLVDDLHTVFTADALGTSHPVRVIPINSPDDIGEIFDAITYNKGAAIIRMLNNILTEEVFLKGLADYLKLHAFENTNSDDLWASLTYADRHFGRRDVKKLMDTWTLQMGYPVLNFHRLSNTSVNVSQKHFLINPETTVEQRFGNLGYVWEVEFSHTHASERQYDTPRRTFLDREVSKVFELSPGVKATDWYLSNIKQYGYYRVNYDKTNWDRLTKQLLDDHKVIPVENRAQLINDAFNLARAGEIDQITALNLTAYLDKEREYLPWDSALTVVNYIRDMYSRHPGYGPLEKYMLQKITPLYESLDWNDDPVNDPHLKQINRINAVHIACVYGLEHCLMKATQLYAAYMANHTLYNPITPNLKLTVYCNGIKEGGQDEWDFGLERLKETTDSAEKNLWFYGLACSQEPWILSRYLELVFDSEVVKHQDAFLVIRFVAENYVGRALAWDFVRANWNRLREQFGDGTSLNDLLRDVTDKFNTEIELKELLDFEEDKDLGTTKTTYTQQVERTRSNIKWMKENADHVARWCEEQTKFT
ncbi:aminopeptidase N-like isoform X2 [Amphiura filiformis]|uniref:aminopeptidase N-like isoform X2 n=1 Tax=Amphiura filiformis TaxID=82378 RepID=UPI003B222C41